MESNLRALVGLCLVSAACSEPPVPGPAAGGPLAPASPRDPTSCASPEVEADRRSLRAALAEGPERQPIAPPRWGPQRQGEGWRARSAAWPHPAVPGDEGFGLVFLPDPLPPGPRPLLVLSPGHFGAGVESDEVMRPAQLLAAEGWLTIIVANRGDELGDAPTPGWRQIHGEDGLYADLRVRRGGTTPLAWDVGSLRRATDLALRGELGAPVDPKAVVALGHSGGAERAAAWAALDPRVTGAVLGAFEYAFDTQEGHAGCLCGALPGANTLDGGTERRHRWIALATCQPGREARARETLLWSHTGDGPVRALLRTRGLEVESREEAQHAFSHQEVVATARWLEARFAAHPWSDDETHRISQELESTYLGGSPDARLAYAPSAPGPGRFEQGPPPWRLDLAPPAAVIRAALGLDTPKGTPAIEDGPALLDDPEAPPWTLVPARSPGATKKARIVVTSRSPDGEGRYVDPWKGEAERAAVFHRWAEVADVVVLDLPFGVDRETDARRARLALAGGGLRLRWAVNQCFAAFEQLRRDRAVPVENITFVGLGAGAVPAILAANLIGETGPVRLASAPVTLWFDGPGLDWADGRRGSTRWGEGEPFQPWPYWTLGSVGPGGALDPWLAAKNLSSRLLWFDPRGGDGQAWTDHLPWGVVETDEERWIAQ